MSDLKNSALGDDPLNIAQAAVAPGAGTNSKPIVWHMFGHDIDIRIVDGVPHVNGARVEPADVAKAALASKGATLRKGEAKR
jgi:hypothetical protein